MQFMTYYTMDKLQGGSCPEALLQIRLTVMKEGILHLITMEEVKKEVGTRSGLSAYLH
jgi:hypothetical protein